MERTCAQFRPSSARPSEACDDGNTADGDGCSSTCMVESGPIDPGGDPGGGCCGSTGGQTGALCALVLALSVLRRRRRVA